MTRPKSQTNTSLNGYSNTPPSDVMIGKCTSFIRSVSLVRYLIIWNNTDHKFQPWVNFSWVSETTDITSTVMSDEIVESMFGNDFVVPDIYVGIVTTYTYTLRIVTRRRKPTGCLWQFVPWEEETLRGRRLWETDVRGLGSQERPVRWHHKILFVFLCIGYFCFLYIYHWIGSHSYSSGNKTHQLK